MIATARPFPMPLSPHLEARIPITEHGADSWSAEIFCHEDGSPSYGFVVRRNNDGTQDTVGNITQDISRNMLQVTGIRGKPEQPPNSFYPAMWEIIRNIWPQVLRHTVNLPFKAIP